ncbi:hypothetical protein NQ318_011381 [Aromia moschata]|uniref:UDP-glycosyltransferases domain-containing protein n=1 Tax=Aromia moschata TaxID=1265417 RepID=A0AAV8YT82_9CUCU|nr:hypothetical protein NQ318_011381 [Aromia moschata]
MKTSIILFLLIMVGAVKSYRILVIFPMESGSHYILGSAVARTLVEAGHDVTLVSPFEQKNPPKNGTWRDVVLPGLMHNDDNDIEFNFMDMESMSPFLMIPMLNMMGDMITRNTLEHKNFQKMLNSNAHFDAIILEQFNNDALKVLAHHYKAPLILFSSLGANSWFNPLIGNPSPPSYIPEPLMPYTSDMTFWQRLENFVFAVLSELSRQLIFFPAQNRIMKEFFPDVPDLSILNYNTSLVFVNSHESTNQPVPRVPNMVDIGGYHINPPKELPKDLKEFMDNATEGVVYFSLGSNVQPSQMSDSMRRHILVALGKLKQKVLWKWDEDTIPGKPDNVRLSKWFPQQDILAHRNTKLFITHSGLLSTIETVYFGVPILAFPVFGDQKLNAAFAVGNGIGLSLSIFQLTEEKLSDALREIINNPKYKENVKRRSKLMHDRPVKPKDLLVYWTEFVIRHKGAPHLQVAALDLPWYRYLLLDVIAFLAVSSVLFVVLFCFIIRKICCSKEANPIEFDFMDMESMSPFLMIPLLNMMGDIITRNMLRHQNFQKLLNSNEHFDAIILEQFNNDGLKVLAHHYKAPLILFSSIGANSWFNPLIGNPSPPSYIPEPLMPYTSDMTFWQRLENFVFAVLSELNRQLIFFPAQNRIMKGFFPDVPDLSILNYNTSLVFVNSHESTNQPVPRVPNMVDIGGYHINPPKELPKDLKEFMDNATEGVVYFSLGSNVQPSQMSDSMRRHILVALGKLKQKVLWKWDEDTIPGKPDNVRLSKWFPQQDILAHRNTKLFITHSGLLSTIETVYFGVPILAIPVFSDQKLNAAFAVGNGIGLSLSISRLTEEKLSDALREIINNPKYNENVKRRSKLMNDRPVKPKDLLVYWTEFVIRHKGAPHLQVAALDLPWYRYLLLDVIAFLAVSSVLLVVLFCFIIRKICCSKEKSKQKVKKN